MKSGKVPLPSSSGDLPDLALPVGREEILSLGINERILRENGAVRWDPQWQCYWVPVDTAVDTWLRLQGVRYEYIVRMVDPES
jgi:hypothetical protein